MRTNRDLDSQLDAYEAQAGSVSRSNRRRARWAAYAAAAGSTLAGTTAAEAEIIYSGALDVSAKASKASAGGYAHATFKLGSSGSNGVIRIRHNAGGRGTTTNKASLRLSNPGVLAKNSSGKLARLASGAKISSNRKFAFAADVLLFSHGKIPSRKSTRSIGTWKPGQVGFAGMKLGSDYGWIKLSLKGTVKDVQSLTVLGWAYNNVAGGPIMAGQVPEPSTALMGLLATGCGGVLAWRRRRRELAASQSADL